LIHLILRLAIPYQQTLCRALSDEYGESFVAWFADRQHDDFPFRDGGEPHFSHRYLSEVGYWRLSKELKADPEAVVILGGWSSPMTNKTLLMTTALGRAVFIWADHPHPQKYGWLRSRARSLYLKTLTRLVTGFLACGQPTVEHLLSLGITRSKVTNFPYWVELPRDWSIPKRCFDDSEAKEPLHLVAVGRHVPVKQFRVAIEAIAIANKGAQRTVARLTIVGDGPERASLEVLAEALACDRAIEFTGWLETRQVRELLTNSDALIVPSTFEPYGVVVLEAMAAGRPVFASTGVVAALDRDDGSGAILIHPAGDGACLAKQIATLANDRELLRAASVASRSIAEKWPPERAITMIEEIITRTNPNLRFLKRMSPKTSAANVHEPDSSSVQLKRGRTAAAATTGK
jgi:glycosyltransferase involved in cell wall biosynthesis